MSDDSTADRTIKERTENLLKYLAFQYIAKYPDDAVADILAFVYKRKEK